MQSFLFEAPETQGLGNNQSNSNNGKKSVGVKVAHSPLSAPDMEMSSLAEDADENCDREQISPYSLDLLPILYCCNSFLYLVVMEVPCILLICNGILL